MIPHDILQRMKKSTSAKSARRYNTDRIDDAVLALMILGVHDQAGRTWKGFDWAALDRLHAKGHISDPRRKAKSVVFTPEGLERAQTLFETMFTTSDEA